MRFSLALALASASLTSSAAFAPLTQPKANNRGELSLKATASRGEFLKQISAAGLGLAFLPREASAAKYGGFGAGSPEVLDPTEAIIDEQVLGSDAVQKSIGGLKNYLGTINSMKEKLAQDSQAVLGPQIRKDLDFVQLRADLNTLGTAFDEDTQRGTDRLVRLILQDITELESADRLKEGVARSERRLSIMNGKLDKLSQAIEDYLAFAK